MMFKSTFVFLLGLSSVLAAPGLFDNFLGGNKENKWSDKSEEGHNIGDLLSGVIKNPIKAGAEVIKTGIESGIGGFKDITDGFLSNGGKKDNKWSDKSEDGHNIGDLISGVIKDPIKGGAEVIKTGIEGGLGAIKGITDGFLSNGGNKGDKWAGKSEDGLEHFNKGLHDIISGIIKNPIKGGSEAIKAAIENSLGAFKEIADGLLSKDDGKDCKQRVGGLLEIIKKLLILLRVREATCQNKHIT